MRRISITIPLVMFALFLSSCGGSGPKEGVWSGNASPTGVVWIDIDDGKIIEVSYSVGMIIGGQPVDVQCGTKEEIVIDSDGNFLFEDGSRTIRGNFAADGRGSIHLEATECSYVVWSDTPPLHTVPANLGMTAEIQFYRTGHLSGN